MATLDRNELALGVIPCLLLLAMAWLLQVTHWDVLWSSRFWDSTSRSWTVLSHWWSWDALHAAQQELAKYLLIAATGYRLYLVWRGRNPAFNHAVTYVLVAGISSAITVAVLKEHTRLPCPWDADIFGGTVPVLGMADVFNPAWPYGQCFPAGHVTGGFAWLSLFFAARALRWKYRYWMLLPGLLIGVLFGLTQQVRGAHFPSHDLVTLAMCWGIAWAWSLIFFRPGRGHL